MDARVEDDELRFCGLCCFAAARAFDGRMFRVEFDDGFDFAAEDEDILNTENDGVGPGDDERNIVVSLFF